MLSIPGVLVSRDRTVRQYVGHSSKNGELYGHYAPDGPGWQAWCADCKWSWGGRTVRNVVMDLRDHRRAYHQSTGAVAADTPEETVTTPPD